MNKIITKTVMKRGKEIPVDQLSDKSQIKVIVECKHGQREIRWSRRNILCKQCSVEAGVFNTCKKGREITWGDKISSAKSGKEFTDSHKKALVEARINKLCKIKGIDKKDFDGFPTSGIQAKLRRRMARAFRKSVIHKSADEWDIFFKKYLDYTVIDLKEHLENKFKDNMSWDNYGEWEIDHVVPESWFNYKSFDDPDFKKCWAKDNFQPLWKKENKCKGNRYSGEYKPRKFIMLCGQSGVGKTTLLSNFTDKFNIIHFDKVNMKELDEIIRNNYYKDKTIIIDIPIKISTIYKKYCEKYNIHMVFLVEDVDIVKSRIASRGGKADSAYSRYRRIKRLSELYGDFTGTSEEVYTYLDSLDF